MLVGFESNDDVLVNEPFIITVILVLGGIGPQARGTWRLRVAATPPHSRTSARPSLLPFPTGCTADNNVIESTPL
jgi:hypothetical protein